MSDATGPQTVGTVYLVGAGPGDPGLLTLRGAECLRRADIVLFDYLVNPVIVRSTSAHAEKIRLGQHGKARIWTQEQINSRLVQFALTGKHVVHLKGGDPSVFGRLAEEVEALRANGIPYEIVPGISAATAVSSHAGIPVTHRGLASAVALVTGQESLEKEIELDFAALARFPGTLVFYMGVSTSPQWVSLLIKHGLPGDTPAALIRRCSFSDQRTVRCRLADVPANLTPSQKFPPPVVVVIGAVAGTEHAIDWFETRPLFGQTVMITRPVRQLDALDDLLAEHGARVIRQPAIEIGPPPAWLAVDRALSRLEDYDWLVFFSANGVRFFFERLFALSFDMRHVAHLKFAALGPATAAELRVLRLCADLQPADFRSEVLADELAKVAEKQRVLLVRASRGRELVARRLAPAAAAVDQVVVYESRDVEAADPQVVEQLAAGHITWTTVTSSAIARSLVRLFGAQLRKTQLASISPVTSQTLRELGFSPAVEARDYTTAGVLAAILAHSSHRGLPDSASPNRSAI